MGLLVGRLFSAKCKIKRVSLVRGFPLTPDPSPQKFGVSLIRLDTGNVRIYGERGAIMEQRDSKVSAVGLAVLTTDPVDNTATIFVDRYCRSSKNCDATAAF